MKSDDDREFDIFSTASALPVGERLAYLDRACHGDHDLRHRILLWLQADDQAGAFMQLHSRATEPRSIGPFRLIRRLGEGGFGVVWEAEQSEPVFRRVALKLIKPGMDTHQVIARFESERQALAMMSHPHIAMILDAGTDDMGRPFFVMELVEGIKMTEYCDRKRLGIRERLNLFKDICRAIHHAHQKGIIHRDIKPSNILVTEIEGKPLPKIIDFGISKAMTGQLTKRTLITGVGQFIGTFPYIAPEQADFTGLNVDTRSDIYSLGVVLYELLTGCTPFDPEELAKVGFEAICRTIKNVEPPRPSNCFGALPAEVRSTTAGARATDIPKLVDLMRDELDWIVMKCLEKDRDNRYRSADDLALDVERYLGNQQVVARPPSTWYLVRKSWNRHKLAVSVASAFVASLVLGLGASLWQAFVARQRLAESLAITEFATNVFKVFEPGWVKNATNSNQSWLEMINRLEAEKRVANGTKEELEWGDGQILFELDLFEKAVPLLEKGLEHARVAHPLNNPKSLKRMADLAVGYRRIRRPEKAIDIGREVSALLGNLLGPDDDETLKARFELALAFAADGKSKDSEQERDIVLELHRQKAERKRTTAAGGVVLRLGIFTNSLGMPFVPVEVPLEKTNLLFCVWETRWQDYAAFASDTRPTNEIWKRPLYEEGGKFPVTPGPTHPVVQVNWNDSHAFCQWLTEYERRSKRIPASAEYRLPTDLEWSAAAGLTNETGARPADRNAKVPGVYPWGTNWPPPFACGNFPDEWSELLLSKENSAIRGYSDGYATTSPVGSYPPQGNGIFDLAGNVWEWCEDLNGKGNDTRVIRGSSWEDPTPQFLLTSARYGMPPNSRNVAIGFRVVLVGGSGVP